MLTLDEPCPFLVLKQDSSQLFGEPTICSLNPQFLLVLTEFLGCVPLNPQPKYPKSAKTSLRGTTEPFQHDMERRTKILLMMMMMMMMMIIIITDITDITELALLVINY